MTDKVQKIREEVERIQLYTQSGVLKQILDFIDSLREEPVGEELEEAANAYISNENNYSHSRTDTFKAGARWQKKQMMKDAVESKVTITSKGILLEDLRIEDFDYEDKVKLIIIKED